MKLQVVSRAILLTDHNYSFNNHGGSELVSLAQSHGFLLSDHSALRQSCQSPVGPVSEDYLHNILTHVMEKNVVLFSVVRFLNT